MHTTVLNSPHFALQTGQTVVQVNTAIYILTYYEISHRFLINVFLNFRYEPKKKGIHLEDQVVVHVVKQLKVYLIN